jgi:hypothetical protein
MQGRIQDFKLGGAHLKKLCRAEGDEKIFGVFRVKNHDFTQKNHNFSNFRGGARAGAPPLDLPLTCKYSFFPRTIKDWNTLPSKLLNIDDVELFKNFTGRIRQ